MFCHQCGKSIPDDARFCSYCGAHFDETTKGPQKNESNSKTIFHSYSQHQESQYQEPTKNMRYQVPTSPKKNGSKVLKICIAVFLVGIAILFCLYWLGSQEDTSNINNSTNEDEYANVEDYSYEEESVYEDENYYEEEYYEEPTGSDLIVGLKNSSVSGYQNVTVGEAFEMNYPYVEWSEYVDINGVQSVMLKFFTTSEGAGTVWGEQYFLNNGNGNFTFGSNRHVFDETLLFQSVQNIKYAFNNNQITLSDFTGSYSSEDGDTIKFSNDSTNVYGNKLYIERTDSSGNVTCGYGVIKIAYSEPVLNGYLSVDGEAKGIYVVYESDGDLRIDRMGNSSTITKTYTPN